MKAKQKVLTLAVIFGISFWILDGRIAGALFSRLFAFCMFVVFGFTAVAVIRRREADIRKEEAAKLDDFVSENPLPSIRITDKGIIVYANAASLPIIASWNKRVGDIVPDNWRKFVRDILKSGIRENIEIECKGRIYSFVTVPSKNKSHINLYGRDITDQKKAMEKLGTAYAELSKTQFNLVQAEKMHVVGALASGVAHEVKNPLAVMLQGIDYLSKILKDKNEKISSVLKYMKQAVNEADKTVRGLLDFSSVSKVDMKEEDLNSVIDQSLELAKPQLENFSIHVTKDFEDIPKVKLDKNRIVQVFVNLVLNAIQAMQDGGEISIRTYPEKSVRSGFGISGGEKDYFEIEEKHVIVEIKDSGSGIPESVLEKVFDPFFTTKRSKGGTGLGLSIVKNIVEMHNGKIKIANAKEGGTKATVTFRL